MKNGIVVILLAVVVCTGLVFPMAASADGKVTSGDFLRWFFSTAKEGRKIERATKQAKATVEAVQDQRQGLDPRKMGQVEQRGRAKGILALDAKSAKLLGKAPVGALKDLYRKGELNSLCPGNITVEVLLPPWLLQELLEKNYNVVESWQPYPSCGIFGCRW